QCGRPANQLSCSKILRAAVGFALPDSERTVNEELQWKFVTAVQLVAPVARVIPTELVGDWCKGTRIEEIVRIVGLPEYLCKVALRPIKPRQHLQVLCHAFVRIDFKSCEVGACPFEGLHNQILIGRHQPFEDRERPVIRGSTNTVRTEVQRSDRSESAWG